MKKLAVILILCVGCARYTTIQTDVSYEKTNIVRTITTKVSVVTFFSGKSDLAKSSVVNTDKSQSSRVGSLSQSATNNLPEITEAVAAGVVKGLVRKGL